MDSIQTQNTSPAPSAPQTPSPKSKSPIILAILGVIAAIGIFGSLAQKKAQVSEEKSNNQTPPSNNESTSNEVNEVSSVPEEQPSPKQAPADIPAGQTYKDGTYAADGSYQSPAGPEQVHLSVTLKNGVVTDSQFSASSQAPKSQMYQGIFSKNYKSLVVGKKIDEIKLTQVSGSSLTSMGFNDALAKIAAQAKM